LDAIARKKADDERKRLEAIAKHHKPTVTIYGKRPGSINPLVKCAISSTLYASIQNAGAPI